MAIERTVLRITETKKPGTSFFIAEYEAAGRQGSDYPSEVASMLGLSVAGNDSDWAEFEDTEEAHALHRDCSPYSNNCSHGGSWCTVSGDGLTTTHYFKGSVANPVINETASDLHTERLAHNVEHEVVVEVNLFPADEHWNLDLENEIV